MKPGSPSAHASHDESLVVRLYGNDVGPEERSRALDLLSGCEECAALFADLAQIASATAALPAPARPRDFTLTPADAARLRPERPASGRSRWLGLTRQLGGAFAALGFAGILVAGALTAFAPASSVQLSSQAEKYGSQGALNAAAAPGGSSQPVAAAASAGPAGSAPSANVANSPVTVSSGPSAPSSGGPKVAVGSPVPSQGDSQTGNFGQPAASANPSTQAAGADTASGGQSSPGGSVDLRPAVLIGSAALLLIGLLLLVGPRLRARRVRG